MHYTLEVVSSERTEIKDITDKVREVIKKSKVGSGIAIIYIPHTTAAVIVNENYDPSVTDDITATLNKLIPHNQHYAHTEGNADGHIKASIIGSSRTVFIENGEIVLGTWQGIFFCEFDGPRQRKVYIKIIAD